MLLMAHGSDGRQQSVAFVNASSIDGLALLQMHWYRFMYCGLPERYIESRHVAVHNVLQVAKHYSAPLVATAVQLPDVRLAMAEDKAFFGEL